LFYRINVIQIDIPPLRDRPNDVVQMAERMLGHFKLQHGRTAVTLTDEARQALQTYAWPGNVRELRNVMERAAILCNDEAVGVEQLRLAPGGMGAAAVRPAGIGDYVPMEKIEELHIRAVLANTPSIEKASQILGMDTVTLWRRRKKFGM
jgi:NtrC-family two-component system response regulator AlgB